MPIEPWLKRKFTMNRETGEGLIMANIEPGAANTGPTGLQCVVNHLYTVDGLVCVSAGGKAS